MKKIGLLVLAMVLALGALGVGYAMWSDTIYIDGTITTGSVDIDIEGTSDTYVYKVMDEYGDLNAGDILCSDEAIDNAALLYVASAVTTANISEDVETVTMTFDNIFPTACNITADVLLHYVGSVPAHVKMSDITWTGDNMTDYVMMQWRLSEDDGNSWVTICDPELLQLHNCYLLWLDVWFDGDALQDAQGDAQGLCGTFSFELMAHQWNEEPTDS
jgi:hypothetical protein